jgi:hypothetical protein
MAFQIEPLVAAASGTYFATLRRQSDGAYWNNTASAWQANPAATDRKIPLAAGTGAYTTSYTATVTGLSDAEWIDVFYHDDTDAADSVVATDQAYIWGGEEISSPGSEIIEVEAGAVSEGISADTLDLYQGVDNRVLLTVTGSPAPNLTTWNPAPTLHLRRTRNGTAFATLTTGGNGLTVQETTNQVEAIITAAHLAAGNLSPLHKVMIYATLSGTSTYEYLTHRLTFRVHPTGLS